MVEGAVDPGRDFDVPYRVTPVEWEVRYPVQSEPIGRIRAVRSGFRAELGEELLGEFPDGDAAVEAVWVRFLEQNRARHAHASVTHGGRERHRS